MSETGNDIKSTEVRATFVIKEGELIRIELNANKEKESEQYEFLDVLSSGKIKGWKDEKRRYIVIHPFGNGPLGLESENYHVEIVVNP